MDNIEIDVYVRDLNSSSATFSRITSKTIEFSLKSLSKASPLFLLSNQRVHTDHLVLRGKFDHLPLRVYGVLSPSTSQFAHPSEPNHEVSPDPLNYDDDVQRANLSFVPSLDSISPRTLKSLVFCPADRCSYSLLEPLGLNFCYGGYEGLSESEFSSLINELVSYDPLSNDCEALLDQVSITCYVLVR
jgi:hypothetical protein